MTRTQPRWGSAYARCETSIVLNSQRIQVSDLRGLQLKLRSGNILLQMRHT